MTHIIFDSDESTYRLSLIVKGHADFAERGKDIVCASVSILTYTIAKIVSDMKDCGEIAENSVIKLDNGEAFINAHCRVKESYDELLGVFSTILTGYGLIADEYPQNVVVQA